MIWLNSSFKFNESALLMAKAFPKSQFYGYDFHPDSIRDAAAHVLEQLQLLLVRVVERLSRVFVLVERLVGLRLEDQCDAFKNAGH